MKSTLVGLRRYLYEYQFHTDIQELTKRSGTVVTVSAARALRAKVDEALERRGLSMSDARLPLEDAQAAFHEALDGVPGYDGVYADPQQRGASNPGYARARKSFFSMTGFNPDGRTPKAGALLPISPYDPRWASRSTVKLAGTSVLYLMDDDVDALTQDGTTEGLTSANDNTKLHTYSDDGRLIPMGDAYSADDRSGLTELMGYMSSDEYRRIRDWVVDQRPENYMTEAGLARARAVLDELNDQGAAYSISRDRNRGQIVAKVAGGKLSVRLTDTRENERFVGRVYDDGIATYFSTNHRGPNNEYVTYEPSPQETVALLRVAQGLPVQRADGKGLVGTNIEAGDAAYTDGKTARFVFGDLQVDGETLTQRDGTPSQVFIRRTSDRSENATWFGTGEVGRELGSKFLSLAVETARLRVRDELDVHRLVEEFEQNEEAAIAGEYYPEMSGDEQLALIQRGYWDVLRGAQTTLLLPGATREDYDEAVSVLADISVSGESFNSIHDMQASQIAYTGTPTERVLKHSLDVLDAHVGTFEPRTVDLPDGSQEVRSFNPATVAKHMSSAFGTWRNTADITAALRATGATPEEMSHLIGDNAVGRRIRDGLVQFDPSSARGLAALEDGSFLHAMATEARDALVRNGVEVTFLAIDDNGILDWSGIRRDTRGNQRAGHGKDPVTGEKVGEVLHGQIGQLFEPGQHGEVITQFGSGENYMFVPGYEARVMPQKAGENLSMEERTRLRGYTQIMAEQIRYQISGDVLSGRDEVGGPSVLNGAYRRLYDDRHEVDYLERAAERGLDRNWAETVLATEARRVRYPNEFSDTMYESWAADRGLGDFDPANDSFGSPLVLTGGRNTAIMDENSDGFFDPDLTNASKPGVTRFLVESAEVNEDGSITPGDKDDRAPVMKHPELGTIKYDPFDRRQMTGMNLMHASGVTRPRRTALMTFGGWGADDGVVISKEFASEHRIMGRDGNLRELLVGDKLSDLHGNKGVVSLVVDRENDGDQALADRDQSMMYAAQVFRDNPDLDVVMSPFSAVGRFNGGTARELMESPGDLVLPLKGMQPALTGEMRFVVTHKDVSGGTRVYDDEALAAGRGRKASAQLAWALDSQDATEVLKEFYGPNGEAVANFREMLVSVGLGMDPDGTLREGAGASNAPRHLFATPALQYTASNRLDRRAMTSEFASQIGTRGGEMELPFALRFPSHGHGVAPREIPRDVGSAEGAASGEPVWRLPVLSSQLRTGQMLDDGTNAAHEYTTQYLKIFEAAGAYRDAEARLNGAFGEIAPAKVNELRKKMSNAERSAQSAFSTITTSLIDRQFESRSNVFKEGLMSSRLASSATAVWSADPRLDIDQVAMSPDMATALGVGADEHVLIWRDPVLRDAGVRYMRVAIDERLTGVAINPVMDKSFDGDFDGDSVAVVKLHGEKAQAEAMRKLSVEANLLDLGVKTDIEFEGDNLELHPLNMQDSLDVKVTQSVQPKFTERFAMMTMNANEIQSDWESGDLTDSQRLMANRTLMGELSTYYREAMEGQYGDAALSFADPIKHLASVKAANLDTGAKGSPDKLISYAKHMGVQVHVDDEGKWRGKDLGRPLHTREEDQGVMVATAVKTAVGIAGAFSQRGVKALRNTAQKEVLELTYPVTQSLLQSKHDPHEAMQKYDLLLSSTRDLWKGREMVRTAGPGGDGTGWAVVTDDRGGEVQATTEQWKKQFVEMYTSSSREGGLNIPGINLENVDTVAQALTGSDGRMRNIEEVGSGLDRDNVGPDQAQGSTMDRLAYGGRFADLCEAALNKENLFDGKFNGHFAPFEIQRNQRELENYQRRLERAADPTRPVPEAELIHIGSRDVLPSTHELARERGASRRSELAPTVRAPRPAVTIESESPEADAFEYEH